MGGVCTTGRGGMLRVREHYLHKAFREERDIMADSTTGTKTTGELEPRTVAGRQLRDYQLEAVNAMEQAPDGAHLVQMATGLGKTVTMAAYHRKGRVLILSHRDELVHQPAKYYDVPVGFEEGPEHAEDEEVVSASVQSLSRENRLHRFKPGEFDTIFTDEAHHALADSYRRIIDWLKPAKHIGLTATPRRGDQRGLKDVYQDIIFQRDLKWGIQHNWLTDIDARRVSVSWDTSNVKRTRGDYEHAALEQVVDTASTNQQVVAAYKELHQGQTLIFASSVQHAHALSELIESSHVIDGTTPPDERRRLIEAFTNREFDCLINFSVFTEGTDLPLIETVLIARPTSNDTLYTQMVGRGLRPAKGKEMLRLIDCVGTSDDKRLCTPPTLFGIDESALPEPARKSKVLDGSLTGLAERIEKACDTPYGWVLRARRINVLDSPLHIAWVTLPDGTRSVSGDGWKATLTAPDLVDHVTATVILDGRNTITREYPDIEQADEAVHRILLDDTRARKSLSLWDKNKVGDWGSEPATDAQMRYLRKLLTPEDFKRITPVSKFEACCAIETHQRETQGVWGACPKCGAPLRPSMNGKSIQCSTNRRRKNGWEWVLVSGCGTWMPASLDGVKLDPAQVRALVKGDTIDVNDLTWKLSMGYDGACRYTVVPAVETKPEQKPEDTTVGKTTQPASSDTDKEQERTICERLRTLLGPVVSEHVTKIGYRNGTLTLDVDHTIWVTQFEYLTPMITAALKGDPATATIPVTGITVRGPEPAESMQDERKEATVEINKDRRRSRFAAKHNPDASMPPTRLTVRNDGKLTVRATDTVRALVFNIAGCSGADVILTINHGHITITRADTGELLVSQRLDPERTYQKRQPITTNDQTIGKENTKE
ncbi:hypothetical protein CSQ85_11885 [Bifidobacterium rousetti]|nr:hypothetical protein CSQ85_11885 [Bifidobacterium rousetti]